MPINVKISQIQNVFSKQTIDIVLQENNSDKDNNQSTRPCLQILKDFKRSSEKGELIIINGERFDWPKMCKAAKPQWSTDDMEKLEAEVTKFLARHDFIKTLPVLNKRYAQGGDAGIMNMAVKRCGMDITEPMQNEFQKFTKKYIAMADGSVKCVKTHKDLIFGVTESNPAGIKIPGTVEICVHIKNDQTTVEYIKCSNHLLANFLLNDDSFMPTKDDVAKAYQEIIVEFLDMTSVNSEINSIIVNKIAKLLADNPDSYCEKIPTMKQILAHNNRDKILSPIEMQYTLSSFYKDALLLIANDAKEENARNIKKYNSSFFYKLKRAPALQKAAQLDKTIRLIKTGKAGVEDIAKLLQIVDVLEKPQSDKSLTK